MKKVDKYLLLDAKIIKYFRDNPRASIAQLANDLKIDHRLAKKRFENLLTKKVMKFSLILNPDYFGYNAIADINITYPKEKRVEIINKMINTHHVGYIAKGSIINSLNAQIRFKSNSDMMEFLQVGLFEINPEIELLDYYTIPEVLKDLDSWEPIEIEKILEQEKSKS